jgi:hypothetical protein
MDAGVAELQAELVRLRRLVYAAGGVAVVALVVAAWALLAR